MATAGFTSGSAIDQKILGWPAPSILADSMNFLVQSHKELPQHKGAKHTETAEQNQSKMAVKQPDITVQDKLRNQDRLSQSYTSRVRS